MVVKPGSNPAVESKINLTCAVSDPSMGRKWKDKVTPREVLKHGKLNQPKGHVS